MGVGCYYLFFPHIIAWQGVLPSFGGVGGGFFPFLTAVTFCIPERASLSDVLVLTAHGLQEIVVLHWINLNLGRCVCPFLTLHFLHIYCCYLNLCHLHVGTHGSCVRSNCLLICLILYLHVHTSTCPALSGRTSRASLQRVAVCLNGPLTCPLVYALTRLLDVLFRSFLI